MNNKKASCQYCQKMISVSNMSRHRRYMHSFCNVCTERGSLKKHSCFNSEGSASFPVGNKGSEEGIPVWLPITISKELYNVLSGARLIQWSDTVNENQDIPRMENWLWNELKSRCFTCFAPTEMRRNCVHYCVSVDMVEFLNERLERCLDELEIKCQDPNRKEEIKRRILSSFEKVDDDDVTAFKTVAEADIKARCFACTDESGFIQHSCADIDIGLFTSEDWERCFASAHLEFESESKKSFFKKYIETSFALDEIRDRGGVGENIF